jgi:methionyl-tRNA formyltransferase
MAANTYEQMKFELDAGDILFQEKAKVDENETTTELRNKLNKRALEIFPEFLKTKLSHSHTSSQSSPNLGEGVEQKNEEATFCKKIKKEDLNINNILDNTSLNREEKLNQIFTKYKAYDKKIYFFTEKNLQKIRIKITEMKKENNEIKILKLLPESKKEINLKDFENSYDKIS